MYLPLVMSHSVPSDPAELVACRRGQWDGVQQTRMKYKGSEASVGCLQPLEVSHQSRKCCGHTSVSRAQSQKLWWGDVSKSGITDTEPLRYLSLRRKAVQGKAMSNLVLKVISWEWYVGETSRWLQSMPVASISMQISKEGRWEEHHRKLRRLFQSELAQWFHGVNVWVTIGNIWMLAAPHVWNTRSSGGMC